MFRSGNKYLIYGLIMTMVLLLLNNSSVNGGRVIFACDRTKNCESTTIIPPTDSANIFRAPAKCKPDEVLISGNKCRRRFV